MDKNIWNQLKSIHVEKIIRALKKDGWKLDVRRGAAQTYISPSDPIKRVSIHYHPKMTYGPKLLKELLKQIGWTDDDLRRLKLIK